MNDFPDFSTQHYQVERELGHNRAGGRVTFLATDSRNQQAVVIKQFQFAKSGSSWANYDSYDREIQILKELNHPGIPRYLDAFYTDDGFCMVQEYKNAESLSTSRSFNPDEIKQIAIAALEILVYLQNRIPPVIHRDFKPENILVDAASNVYLVDFGFARVGEGEVGVSSVVKGTLGFMPPEQLFNRQLTEASDLYGLGMTLICLLTSTKSDNIGDLVDISYRVSFKHLVPKLNMHWVNWLEKMVEPRLKDRYPNALAALAAVPTSPVRPPEAQFSQSTLAFMAKRSGEFLVEQVTITNPIPETTLEGQWELAPHPNDPPVESYCWIMVEPEQVVGNQIQCQITVDTRKLMAGKTYHRRLLLHANTLAQTYSLNLQVQILRLPSPTNLVPYGFVSLLGLFFVSLGWFVSWFSLVLGTVAGSVESAGIGTLIGCAIGLEGSAWLMRSSGWRSGSEFSTLAAILLGGIIFTQIFLGENLTFVTSAVLLGTGLGVLSGAIGGIAINLAVEKMLIKGNQKFAAIALSLAIGTLGTSFGLGLNIGLIKPLALIPFTVSIAVCIILLTRIQLNNAHKSFTHKRSERYLIKP